MEIQNKTLEFDVPIRLYGDGSQNFAGSVSVWIHDDIVEFIGDQYDVVYEDPNQNENFDHLFFEETVTATGIFKTLPEKTFKPGVYHLYFEANMFYSHMNTPEGIDYDLDYDIKKITLMWLQEILDV